MRHGLSRTDGAVRNGAVGAEGEWRGGRGIGLREKNKALVIKFTK